MEDNKEKLVILKYLKYAIYLVLIITLVVLAQFFINRKISDTVLNSVNYFDKPSIDYRVYYTKNPWYQQSFITKGKSYVSSLVKYIDIDFSYYLNYSDKLDAKSQYNVKATIIASDANTGEVVWDDYTKELLEDKVISVNNSMDYNINETVRINFSEYNSFLSEFKNNNQMPVNAYLKVVFNVQNSATHKYFPNINSNNTMELRIPLNEGNFKITELSESKSNEYKNTESRKSEKTVSLVIGVILWIVAIFLAVYLALQYHKDIKKEGAYHRKLKKILSAYDSIIVNVKKLPLSEDLSIVQVTSFEELVDAQNEVRLPINFKEDKAKHIARFVLIRNNLAWVYTLKEGDLSEK